MNGLPREIDRVFHTDVLVVGGGGAGASAAVAAARGGCRVLVAVKGRLGKSGSTFLSSAVVAMDGKSARKMGQRRADPSLTQDRWFEQIVHDGFFLSEQPLARLFVEQAPASVAQLLQWGQRARQPYVFGAGGSWVTTGRAVALSLRQGAAETAGISRLEDVMICELILRSGRIAGALGIDLHSGELIFIRCRAVIVATGGFQPFSFKCTGSDTTGDGIAMAFRAGAALADMEFFLFAPGVLLSPRLHRGSILPVFLLLTGQIDPDILAADGSDLTAALSPEVRRLARDRRWYKVVNAVLWSEARASGRTTDAGGVYFDFGRYSTLRYHIGLLRTFYLFRRLNGRRFRYQGRSIEDLFARIRRGGRWEVGLCAEYSLGGIVVDDKMATAVAGLYAAGEAASGTFGATRTARALTEIMVQGFAAGASAAHFAKDAGEPSSPGERLEEACRKVLAPLERPGSETCGPVLAQSEAAADASLGVRRDPEALAEGLEQVMRLKTARLPELGGSCRRRRYNLEWIQALQLGNRLCCLEAAFRGALARTESRGQHLRLDAPGVDNENWLKRIHISAHNEEMVLAPKLPGFDHIAPPRRNFSGIVDYAVACRRREEGGAG